ncbi:MAG: SpoIIE family protein phosphatase [Bacteroidales bacterium]|nr:SpoIIE family protein phosphatase [Bacteroidales bacterium]
MKRALAFVILMLQAVACLALDDKWSDKKDSLLALCNSSFGSYECLAHCEEGIRCAHEADDLYSETSITMLKVATYFNLRLFDRVIEFCDSLEHDGIIKQRYPRGFYIMMSYRSEAYINKGKYRLAMEHAKEVYDAGMDMIENKFSNKKIGAIDGKMVVAAAIENMSCAYVNIGRRDLAVEYLDNGIKMCREDVDSLYIYFLELNHYKFNALINSYVAGDDDGFVEDYMQAIDVYKKYAGENVCESDEISFVCEVCLAKLKIAIKNNDRVEATKLVDRLDRMYDEDEVLKYSKSDYYLTKVDYCMYVGDMRKALAYCDSCLMDEGVWQDEESVLRTLRQKLEANHKIGAYDKDYTLAKQIMDISDSISHERMSASIEEVGVLMGLDMAKMETQKKEAEKRQWAMIAIIAVMSAVLIVVVFIIRQNKQQKKILELEVARQTKEINEKNRDITDSINYAQRIQSALLPNINDLKNNGIEGAYVFFKPRNIVSGDFYWAHNEGNKMLLACADCTGHGVPGAFMSMIGTTLLNDICANEQGLKPGEILEHLDSQLISILSQKGQTEVQDGMDVAMIRYDAQSRILQTAGARRPVYLVHNGVIKEIKGTKRSIGERDANSRLCPFETVEVKVERGDTLYMCSDGIADQFGGQNPDFPNGKRLKSAGLKKMLEELNRFTIGDQQAAIEKMYTEWKGSCYQVDDVSIIGLRF